MKNTQLMHEQAEVFAQSIVEKQNGFKFEAVVQYTHENGDVIYWKLRAKNPNNGQKFIRSFSLEGSAFVLKEPDFREVFPQGNGSKPLYALYRISVSKDQPIYVVEGEQKADYLNKLGLYATTTGGCQSVSKTDLSPLFGRSIIVWPDNDEPGLKFLSTLNEAVHEKNTLVSVIKLDELNLESKDDVIDWVEKRAVIGLETSIKDVQNLTIVPYKSTEFKQVEKNNEAELHKKSEVLAAPMPHKNGQFEITSDGVHYLRMRDGELECFWLSTPVLILAKTRDQTSNDWGRLLKWVDDANVEHKWALPMETLQTDGADMRKALAHMGVTLSTSRSARELFQTYIANYPVDTFAKCVNRVGWHDHQYILPNNVIGENSSGELIVYQSTHNVIDKYVQKGTLNDWQNNVAKYSENHDFLVLALSSAFTGQLLEPLGRHGAGIHFKGKSSKGKSTAVFIACSVWGNPESYYHTWRNTSNALEQTAFTHNDGLLVLDEIGEIPNPKDLGNIIYMLINGSGKGRMTKSLTVRETARWRLVFLSSGEKTLSELMNEAGQQAKLGQEIRLINIDIDQSEHGIFDQIDFSENAAQQALLLNSNIKQHYGVAGAAWLQYLTSDKVKVTEIANRLLDEYAQVLIGQHKQGHIIRVANYFALVAVSGEMATIAGITGWKSGTAIRSVQNIFNHWIGNFEQVGDYEDEEILNQVRTFFTLHGSSRFELINTEFSEQTKVFNRMGFVKVEADERQFYVYPEIFKQEICKSLNSKVVAKVLKKYGWIDCDGKLMTKVKRLPESEKVTRLYVFNANVMMNFDIEAKSEIKQSNSSNFSNMFEN